jgi:hypothetical protein
LLRGKFPNNREITGNFCGFRVNFECWSDSSRTSATIPFSNQKLFPKKITGKKQGKNKLKQGFLKILMTNFRD